MTRKYTYGLIGLLVCLLGPCSAWAQEEGAVWDNYDFVPGDTVLFHHDFEGARVGNFPSRLDYLKGSMEVVALADGNRALRTKNEGWFEIPLGQPFPNRYTIEFRVHTNDPAARIKVLLYSGAEGTIKSPAAHPVVLVDKADTGLTVGKYNDGPKATEPVDRSLLTDEWAHVRIAVDGPYWKVYVNESRVANVPQVMFPPAESFRMYMSIYPYDGQDVYIDDLRIAQGGPRSLYDDLMSEGFFITQGIYFDTGSAALRPESGAVLRQLLEMMQEHPDLHIRVEGHTDSTGSDAVNTPLSQARADAVRQWLVEQGVSGDRVTAQGYGPSRPVASNDTAEGRAQNRRTEIHLDNK